MKGRDIGGSCPPTIVAEALGCRAGRGVPRLDRRDRRAARSAEIRRRHRARWPAASQPAPWMDAAKAIMTTDTFPKVATATVEFDGVPVTIAGIAKGSGMIAPDMATMLSFVFTDAPIAAARAAGAARPADRDELQRHHRRQRHLDLRHAARLCDRQGAASRRSTRARRSARRGLRRGARRRAVRARHARGARRRGRDQAGRPSPSRARRATRARCRIAQSIANSPLVKTAIAGEDANWGRVVMAVGKAGEPADRDKLSIWFGDIRWSPRDGERAPGYDEAATSAYMKSEELEIRVDLGLGDGHGDRLHLRPDARLHRHQRQLPELIVALPGADVDRAGRPQGLAGAREAQDGAWVRARRQRLHQARQLGAVPRSQRRRRCRSCGIAAAVRWFEARGMPPIFRVTPLAGSARSSRRSMRPAGQWSTKPRLGDGAAGRRLARSARRIFEPLDPSGSSTAQQQLRGYDRATARKLARTCSAASPCPWLRRRALLARTAMPVAIGADGGRRRHRHHRQRRHRHERSAAGAMAAAMMRTGARLGAARRARPSRRSTCWPTMRRRRRSIASLGYRRQLRLCLPRIRTRHERLRSCWSSPARWSMPTGGC